MKGDKYYEDLWDEYRREGRPLVSIPRNEAPEPHQVVAPQPAVETPKWSWIPSIRTYGSAIADASWEAEGRSIELTFGPFVIELTIARKDRVFSDGEAS